MRERASATLAAFAGPLRSWWQLPLEIAGVYLVAALLGSLATEPFTGRWARASFIEERPDPGILIEAVLLSLAVRARASRGLVLFVGAVIPFGIVLWNLREFLEVSRLFGVLRPAWWSSFWRDELGYMALALPGSWASTAWAVYRRNHAQSSRIVGPQSGGIAAGGRTSGSS